MIFETGWTKLSGYQSSLFAIPVCSSMQRTRSGQGETQFHPLFVIDPPGDGYRLVADAARDIDIVQGELEDLADLIFVDPARNRRHIDDLDAGLADRLDRLQLVFQQLAAAGLLVDMVVHAVELKINGVQARFRGTHA